MRQPRDVRLQTREARRGLAPKKEPYWHELRRGLHVGYYKGSSGGTWWLREYRDGTRPKRRLGIADDDISADGMTVLSWPQVITAALRVDRPTLKVSSAYTVDDAFEVYWHYRAAKSPALSVAIDKSKASAHLTDELRARPIAQLTTAELEAWLHGLVPTTSDREKQRRAKATADRVRRLFFAVLNYAYRTRRHDVPLADAWRAVQPYRNVDQPRKRFLSVDEAKRLLNAMAPDFRRLSRGALYTGLRLGELLSLKVADIVDGQVYVQHSKSGKGRAVPLSQEGIDFFDTLTAGRSGEDPMFLRENGTYWKPMPVSRSMRTACKAADVKPTATFHDLRRTYGSLLLNRGADAEVVQELLGHADLRMTRRAYAHLLNSTIAKVVKKKLPSFALERSNVRRLRPRQAGG